MVRLEALLLFILAVTVRSIDNELVDPLSSQTGNDSETKQSQRKLPKVKVYGMMGKRCGGKPCSPIINGRSLSMQYHDLTAHVEEENTTFTEGASVPRRKLKLVSKVANVVAPKENIEHFHEMERNPPIAQESNGSLVEKEESRTHYDTETVKHIVTKEIRKPNLFRLTQDTRLPQTHITERFLPKAKVYGMMGKRAVAPFQRT